jgi:hypothetical protein
MLIGWRRTRPEVLSATPPARPRTSQEAGAFGVVAPKQTYIDERLFAGSGVVDAAAALEWLGFLFEGRGHSPAPGTEGCFVYFCAELQATAKMYGPRVWIGSMGPGPTTNSSSFEDLCVRMAEALQAQQKFGSQCLTRLGARLCERASAAAKPAAQ